MQAHKRTLWGQPKPSILMGEKMKLPQDKKMPQVGQQCQIHEHKTFGKVMPHEVLSKECWTLGKTPQIFINVKNHGASNFVSCENWNVQLRTLFHFS